MTPPLRSRPRTVCYLAETDAAARDGAAALEAVDSGPDRTVQPLSTDAIDQLARLAPETDCVVFAETPTTAAGATLLEVVDACEPTPLVLFTDAGYAPTAARSTDGIRGYVRRDTGDAVAHLADEIEWVCASGREPTAALEPADDASKSIDTDLESEPADRESKSTDTESESYAASETESHSTPDSESDVIAMGAGNTPIATDAGDDSIGYRSAANFLESIPEVAACDERSLLFDELVKTAADALEIESCWLSTVHFGELTPRATAPGVAADDIEPVAREGILDEALRTGDPIRIDDCTDDDRLEAPLEGVRSLCCVPVGDAGLLLAASEELAAFDERESDLLATWGRVGSAVLERLESEASLRNDRDRLRQELSRAESERDRIADERDELAAERDRLAAEHERVQALFENAPEPAIRYEIDDGQPIVRAVNAAFTEVFDAECETVVDAPLEGTTVPPGLEQRQVTLTDALRAGERRQLVSRRETADGVREFRLTLVPLEAADSDRIDPDVEDSDGTEPDVSDSNGSRPDSDGASGPNDGTDHNPEGLIVYTDVTDANRTERELAAAEARLETIADLIEGDVRTPLNVARGYLELVEATGDAEHFAEVDTAQEELRERVEELMAIARRDEVIVDTEPVAIHDVARRAWVAVDTGEARLVTRENLVLEADKSRLRELFEHLLQAAVESTVGGGEVDDSEGEDDSKGEDRRTAEPGVDPVVTVSATDDGFAVTGHRVAPEVGIADREPTAVPGQLTAADGTGFGLGPVERIADAHGWDVCVAENDGAGFVFRGVEPADVDGN